MPGLVMARLEFAKSTKKDANARSEGRCEAKWDGVRCNTPFAGLTPQYHHIIEAYLGGRATLENCMVVCIPCHKLITKKRAPVLEKVERILERKAGITRIKQKIPNRGWR
jgi:5-methylcytosine-specific restriction protein A